MPSDVVEDTSKVRYEHLATHQAGELGARRTMFGVSKNLRRGVLTHPANL